MPARAPLCPLAALALALALIAPACGPVEADHPLDPDTPAAEQRPSRIAGRLVAPGGDAARPYADMTARLYAADAERDAPTHTSPVDDGGRFRFDAVRPGTYRFDAGDARLAADPFALHVPSGEVLDIGDIALEPILGVVEGAVLDDLGAPVDGARITLADVPAALDADGRFHATTGAGPTPISATAPGHRPVTRTVEVVGGATTAVDPLVLRPEPPTISGVVRLISFETVLRRSTARAALYPDDADPTADPIAEATADLEGRFVLSPPSPGRYRLDLTAPGYDPATLTLDAAPGAMLDLGAIGLQHASTGPDAVWLRGNVRDPDGPLGGVAVEITLAPALPFARVLTARDGRFALPVAPDEDHHLRVDLDGYAPLDVGPYRYAPDAAAMVDPAGDPPDLVLTPLP